MEPKRVIEGVPRPAFYPATKCPEDLSFPACMKALSEYLRDERFGCCDSRPEEKHRAVPCANKFFVGLSGIGFAMNWKWDYGAFNLVNIDRDPAPHIRRCFAALGLECAVLVNPSSRAFSESRGSVERSGRGEMTAAILACIDRGLPCVAFGVLPVPEACLICGYDEGGDVLIGWSHFQDFPEFAPDAGREPSGHFRRRGWFEHTLCVVIPGDPPAQPQSLGELCVDAVCAGLRLLECEEGVDGFLPGFRGYRALIEALRDPDVFACSDDAVLRRRFEVINNLTGDIAEAKCYAGDFLRSPGRGAEHIGSCFPDAAAGAAARALVERAAEKYMVIHNLMWNVWEAERGGSQTMGWPVNDHTRMREPGVREAILRLYTRVEEAEREIHRLLSSAISSLDGGRPVEGIRGPVVLARTPYIGFDRSRTGGTSKTTYMGAAMEAAFRSIGEEYAYPFVMGVSGAAFRLNWGVDAWDGGSISTLLMDDDPLEHFRRIYRATGWSARILGNARWQPSVAQERRTSRSMGPDYLGAVEYSADKRDFVQLLTESIVAREYPVLCVGTMMPPETGIICGYDADGDAVYGFHHFQHFLDNRAPADLSFDREGRFVKRNWFDDTIALAAFHYKGPKPPVENTYRASVRTALDLIRTPRFRRHHSGLAAYRAWADAVGQEWPDDVLRDEQEMGVRLMCHNDGIACLLDGRAAARDFMADAASVLLGKADELRRISALYGRVVEQAERMIGVLGGFRGDAAAARAFERQEVRLGLAEEVRAAARIEEEIAGMLELVLADGS